MGFVVIILQSVVDGYLLHCNNMVKLYSFCSINLIFYCSSIAYLKESLKFFLLPTIQNWSEPVQRSIILVSFCRICQMSTWLFTIPEVVDFLLFGGFSALLFSHVKSVNKLKGSKTHFYLCIRNYTITTSLLICYSTTMLLHWYTL